MTNGVLCLIVLEQELEAAKNETLGKAEELKAVKRENRKRRKVVEAYQDMMSAGATGLHTVSYVDIQMYLHVVCTFYLFQVAV